MFCQKITGSIEIRCLINSVKTNFIKHRYEVHDCVFCKKSYLTVDKRLQGSDIPYVFDFVCVNKENRDSTAY